MSRGPGPLVSGVSLVYGLCVLKRARPGELLTYATPSGPTAMPMWAGSKVIRPDTVPAGWLFPSVGSGAVSFEHAGNTASTASAARAKVRRCMLGTRGGNCDSDLGGMGCVALALTQGWWPGSVAGTTVQF